MRNFLRLATSLVALTLVVSFTSCEKQTAKIDDGLSEVVINITNVTDNIKKAGDKLIPECSDAVATHAVVTGVDPLGNPVLLELPILQQLENGTQTVVIKTQVLGEYTITGFEVCSNADMIWAAPKPGSDYYEWTDPERRLDLMFTVEAFTKKKIDIDVMCIDESTFEEFGYFWFEFHKIAVKNICFFGDICTPDYENWYDGQTQMDFPAAYIVTITNNSTGEIVAQEETDGQNGPLCIQYPANPDDDSSYNVEIAIFVPWQPEPVPVWSGELDPNDPAEDFYPNQGDDADGIFDFVLFQGNNCNYSHNSGVDYVATLPSETDGPTSMY